LHTVLIYFTFTANFTYKWSVSQYYSVVSSIGIFNAQLYTTVHLRKSCSSGQNILRLWNRNAKYNSHEIWSENYAFKK